MPRIRRLLHSFLDVIAERFGEDTHLSDGVCVCRQYTGRFVHIDATEPDPGIDGRSTEPLTPRNAAGMVALWEEHDRGRIGIEAYYTGEQDLEGNPYRTKSQRNVELGMLGELTLGNASVFLNLKNILDVRQPQGFTAPPNARA